MGGYQKNGRKKDAQTVLDLEIKYKPQVYLLICSHGLCWISMLITVLCVAEFAYEPPVAHCAMDHRVVGIVGISDGYI